MLKQLASRSATIDTNCPITPIRKNDRGYAVGHELHLREWDPSTEEYSGRSVHCEVIHITDGGEFGLPKDMCAMGILRLDS